MFSVDFKMEILKSINERKFELKIIIMKKTLELMKPSKKNNSKELQFVSTNNISHNINLK